MSMTTSAVTGWAAVLLVAVLLPAVAHADTAAVIVGGPGKASDKAVVAKAVRERIVERRWFVRDVAVDQAAVEKAIECLGTEGAQSCTQGLVSGVDRLLVLSVREDHNDGIDSTRVAAWLVSSSGELIVAGGRVCESCRTESLQQHMGDLVVWLWQQAIVRSGKTALNVRVTPRLSNVVVMVDDEQVAEGVEKGVFPGDRRIVVSAPGYCPEERVVKARAQQIVPVEVQLQRCEGAGRRLWPWLTIGAGALAVGGGIVLVAVDDDEQKGGERNYEFRNTAPYGIASISAGTVAVGIGVAGLLLWRGPDEGRPRPVVSRTVSGWSLGIEGRF
jgi:hypothetical protein